MIEINQLTKRYTDNTVLDIEELAIPGSQSFGLVGNNGAGKTTLFRIILDLVRPTTGDVLMDKLKVNETEEWKFFTGSFLDEKFLIGYLTPDEYFDFLAKTYNLNKTDKEEHLRKFEDIFAGEILGRKKYIRDLSKGNKKKVGIAGALLGNPKVVLLDEPFENLDPSSQGRLKRIINNYRQQKEIIFLISSHDLSQVTEITDRIVILEKGKIHKDMQVNADTLQELKAYFEGALQADLSKGNFTAGTENL